MHSRPLWSIFGFISKLHGSESGKTASNKPQTKINWKFYLNLSENHICQHEKPLDQQYVLQIPGDGANYIVYSCQLLPLRRLRQLCNLRIICTIYSFFRNYCQYIKLMTACNSVTIVKQSEEVELHLAL